MLGPFADGPRTLMHVLAWRACHQPNVPAFAFLDRHLEVEDTDSYGTLARAARAVAGALDGLGAGPLPVLIACEPGLDFVRALCGIMWSGRAAAPVPPPRDRASSERLLSVAADLGARWVMGSRATVDSLQGQADLASSGLSWVAVEDCMAAAPALEDPASAPEQRAIVQYTSGTVGVPHGVALSHANLMDNSELIRRAFCHTSKHRGMIWLPPYHDMGLVGGILQPLYAGFRTTLMSPRTFLRDPLNWLLAVSRTGASTSGGPNFAYDSCLRISDESLDRVELDLTSWEVAFNGAETVFARTLDEFSRRFRRFGFRRRSFLPCYGLAEATLLVSGAEKRSSPTVLHVDRQALARAEVAIVAESEGRALVGHGAPAQTLRIVDSDGRRAPPLQVGEIWVAGASVAQPTSPDDERFGARVGDEAPAFVRTGDLGFLHKGQLYITGRCKAVMVVRGRNHHAEDVEATSRRLRPELAELGSAAFADDSESVVLVQEVTRDLSSEERGLLLEEIRAAVAQAHGITLSTIVLVRRMSLPRTPSGKVRRRAVREALAKATLRVVETWHAPEAPASSATPRAARPPCPSLDGLTNASAVEAVRDWLMAIMSAELQVPVSELAPDTHFGAYGLDSAAALALSAHLAEQFDCGGVETLFWDYPNFTMLSAHLAARRRAPAGGSGNGAHGPMP